MHRKNRENLVIVPSGKGAVDGSVPKGPLDPSTTLPQNLFQIRTGFINVFMSKQMKIISKVKDTFDISITKRKFFLLAFQKRLAKVVLTLGFVPRKRWSTCSSWLWVSRTCCRPFQDSNRLGASRSVGCKRCQNTSLSLYPV
ncbi:hypothetical protein CEXT_310801 [Caerostris extrusa]|uniref:Uncharacterized protein n=1 Tax=Caerostris extrusa TaxID=172846 RepID=A0AAV4S4X6_CAEEX|nr:hypothetical protein CEXT_310801 [Caerostris extrusa]